MISDAFLNTMVFFKYMNIDCIYQADAELNVLVYFDLETTGCN